MFRVIVDTSVKKTIEFDTPKSSMIVLFYGGG